ncbi:MAG: hypothetical protein HC797_08275 [Anaerolineales bacterium]|nr:hypothetical protein [Anaerolineales bacterium]
MLIYAIKYKHIVLTALGMALLTFKPHIGGLILLAGLVYLWVCHTEGRLLPEVSLTKWIKTLRARRPRSLRVTRIRIIGKPSIYTLYTVSFLFLIGFLADSSWPVNYLGSLFSYRDLGHITTCSECVTYRYGCQESSAGIKSLAGRSNWQRDIDRACHHLVFRSHKIIPVPAAVACIRVDGHHPCQPVFIQLRFSPFACAFRIIT